MMNNASSLLILQKRTRKGVGLQSCEGQPFPSALPTWPTLAYAAGLEKTGEISATREQISWFSRNY